MYSLRMKPYFWKVKFVDNQVYFVHATTMLKAVKAGIDLYNRDRYTTDSKVKKVNARQICNVNRLGEKY